jgi:inositol transport system permease protein
MDKNITAVLSRVSAFLSKYSILVVLAAVFIISCILNQNFLSLVNLTNILRQNAVVVILAFGATMLIISGMIDLSSGAVIAFTGCFSIWVFKATGNIMLAFGSGLALAIAFNAISGILVTIYKTPPFIATLAITSIARGGVLLFTGGRDIYQIGDFVVFGQGYLFRVPVPVIFMFAMFLFTWYILNHTRFGRALYAIGGNQEAAIASGIKVNQIKFQCYILNGFLVGLAGIIFMSRINDGIPGPGSGYEMEALTAAIIGGTSFSGGVGSAVGTLAGAFIVGIINNIMNLVGINPYVQQIVKGVIIVLAVILDLRAKNKRLAVKEMPAA